MRQGCIDALAIEEGDIAELEEIDPFRAWREEPDFEISRPWPLTTHQLRRSLAVYANASGLVRLSSLRRQLQHVTREMALYYGRGSTFCKNFIQDDPKGYNKHVAIEWQNGAEEAEMLAFVRDVLHSKEHMFGGAGSYYERQRDRGEVMSREEVTRQMKAGLLSYRESPLGGCTGPGTCETRKGLNFIDAACATDGCKHLIGKHSKIVQTIQLKRAAMAHITPGSVTAAMEQEELEALASGKRPISFNLFPFTAVKRPVVSMAFDVNLLVAIGDMVEQGGQVMFCRRDANTAREDLLRMLRSIEKSLKRPPRGGVYVSCLGRGRNLFAKDSEELKLIESELGELPLVGFYANGEISKDRLYGYTGVLTLFL